MPDHVELYCLVDESGSMQLIIDDVLNHFNTFMKETVSSGDKILATLIFFNEKNRIIKDDVDCNTICDSIKSLSPSGLYSAVYDSIGQAIDMINKKIMIAPTKPKKIIICTVSDFNDYHSTLFSLDKINRMINQKKALDKWEFVFINCHSIRTELAK
jgi:hypothetical protein